MNEILRVDISATTSPAATTITFPSRAKPDLRRVEGIRLRQELVCVCEFNAISSIGL